MLHRPWIEPNTIFTNEPIVITTSRKGYLRWLGGLITSLLITLWFYGLYFQIPSQKGAQIALSLMIGLDVWLFVRIAELFIRRASIDFSGISYYSLFSKEFFEWANVKQVEWWYDTINRTVCYRIRVEGNQALATFNTATWANLNEGIGYTVARTRREPISTTPHNGLKWAQTIALIFMPLVVLIFSLSDTELTRIISFSVVHLFWTIIVWQYSRLELRTLQFYMAILSVTVVFSMVFFSGSDFQSTLIWWLYTPMIEVVISFIVVELYKLWKKKQIQLQIE